MRTLAPLLPIGGVWGLVWSCARVVRKRGALGVGLAPEGVYHWARFGCVFFSWDLIRKVVPTRVFVADLRSHRRRATNLPVNMSAVNPAVVYLALEFYLRHPELRDELAGEKGLRRIREVDFPELVSELRKRGELSAAGT